MGVMNRNNKQFLIGFIPSMILPFIFMEVFIYFNYNGTMDLLRLLVELFKMNRLAPLLAVGAVPNIFLFFFAMNRERWTLGRGVLAATLFYGAAVMSIKFLT
jgi:hypothetical protein